MSTMPLPYTEYQLHMATDAWTKTGDRERAEDYLYHKYDWRDCPARKAALDAADEQLKAEVAASKPVSKPNGRSTDAERAQAKKLAREAQAQTDAAANAATEEKQPPVKTETMTTPVEEKPIEVPTAPLVTEDDLHEDQDPLTEDEAIHLVKVRARENKKLPPSKQETAEQVLASLKEGPRTVSDSRLEEIVATYWPKASVPTTKPTPPAFPPELVSLVDSGRAFFEDRWLVKRCSTCGQFNRDECCGQRTANVLAVRSDGVLTRHGRQAVGLDPIKPPQAEPTLEQKKQLWSETDWWKTFSGFDELEDGGLKMYIENFLPEGIAIISSLPKEGKTWLALSIVKALTTGKPLFGKLGFEVTEKVPVLYLAAEASDRAFKHRVSKFGITNDKTKFLCRTLTKGMIGLQNPDLEAAVRALKPVVILDVLSCFNQSDDEDDAVQNQKLRSMIGNLRTQGAPVIIVLHHTTKNFKDKPTKENAVRGSGDILAMVDVIWALMMDDRLFQSGVKEVDVIGWGRDFEAAPMRLALTRKATGRDLSIFGPGIASIIDETGDLGWVDKEAVREAAEKADEDLADALERMVQADSLVSLRTLVEVTGQKYYRVREAIEGRGWTRGKSRSAKWEKDGHPVEQVSTRVSRKSKRGEPEP